MKPHTTLELERERSATQSGKSTRRALRLETRGAAGPEVGATERNCPRLTLLFAFAALFLLTLGAHAQSLNISGVGNESAYNNSVTFTIQTQSGFDYLALLDSKPVGVGTPVTVTNADYHELQVFRTNQATLQVTNRLVQFVVRSSERGDSENGLPPWTPYPMIPSAPGEFTGANLRLLLPQSFPAGYDIPVAAWIQNGSGHAVRVNGSLSASGHPSIDVKRGAGSGFLASTSPAGELSYAPQIGPLQSSNVIHLESSTEWIMAGGTLSGATVWPPNARIAVTNGLTLPAGATLTINEGVIVRVGPAVDIQLDGTVQVNGTRTNPVVFMPVSRDQPWGGFLLEANSSQFTATGTIFTGSGAVQNWFGSNGRPESHRREQALFFCRNAPALSLTDCAAIHLAGQFGHSVNGGTITLTRVLMQRATSGGQFTGATLNVNDSAFIECPDDSADFVDGDNDGLYIVNGTHGFTNTLFGWVKDDSIDSGASGSGLLSFQNCWFESAFHEANSLSGTGKNVNHYDGVFINNGQGLEAGYSGPVGTLARCLVTGNLTGGRFGDNYLSQSYSGFLRATNSILINNYRDLWGMNFQDWTYRASAMDVHSNFLGVANNYHPDNFVWNPLEDGWRLAPFMSTPPDAPVGVGLAVRAGQLEPAVFAAGLPVRLSSFTTNPVLIGYSVESSSGPISGGTLEFQPGETLKFIPAIPLSGEDLVRVRLHNPVRAEITGRESIYLVPEAFGNTATLIPTGALWRYLDTGENAGAAWRETDFNDNSWLSGAAELGYGDGDEATLIRSNGVAGRIITTYFRCSFVIADPAAYSGLTLNLRRDDGGVVYLNGTEVFRSNMTNAPGVPIASTDFAGNSIVSESAFFTTNASAALLLSGTNVVAAEIHQNTLTSSDVSFEFELDATLKPRLQHARFGNDWVLFWSNPGAILEETDNLQQPWSEALRSSPITIDFSNPQKFYRLRHLSQP